MSRRNNGGINDFIESDDDASDVDQSLATLATGQKRRAKRQKVEIVDPYANETPEQKRVRLAKEYITSLGLEQEDEEEKLVEDDDISAHPYGNDALALALREQALRLQGKERRIFLANTINYSAFISPSQPESFDPSLAPQIAQTITPRDLPIHAPKPLWVSNGHRWTITALTLSDDNSFAITCSLDGSIMRHDTATGKRTKISLGTAKGQKGHRGAIFGASISSDNVYLATGGDDHTVRIWDLRKCICVHTFTRHRAAVRAVKFKRDSLALFSTGDDRTVCLYDIEQMNFMETLYGHTKPVIAMDALYQDRIFTCGLDSSCRVWKLETESQLVFEGKKEMHSFDCLTAIDHDTVVTGSQANTLSLWNTKKRKPIDVVHNAHSSQTYSHLGTERYGPTVQTLYQPVENWVSAVHSVYSTDLVASGSSDGFLRFWQTNIKQQTLKQLFAIPIAGYINGIQLALGGKFVLVSVGKNNRLGSWTGHITKGVHEGLYCFDLSSIFSQTEQDDDDEDDETQ